MPWWGMHQYNSFWQQNLWGQNAGSFSLFPLIVPTILWSLVWKGLALYRAAQSEQKGWFVALLVINTMGIFEIVYLLFFSQSKSPKHKS